jgi:hypothetical protein
MASIRMYEDLIQGRRDGTLYVTFNTYINELPYYFMRECRMHNIKVAIVDRCDRRRNTFELHKDNKCDQS